ncbi:MAG: ArsA family ATPase [Lachnospiraceae bacterium]|nr:ArsA family ATPase [Lachnospiraceae bacterium]
MRIILYTGKGGVGKTTVAASAACRLAAEGKKVLIMSTDQAHSLGDSLETKLGNEPVTVMEGLDALEIDTVKETEKAWGKLRSYLTLLLTSRDGESLETEELLAFPGFDELFSLLTVRDIYEANEYDVLIVDCAPTGETLSLLKFPEMMGNLLQKALPVKRKAVKAVGPAVEKLTKIPMPKDEVFDEVLWLTAKLDKLKNLMINHEVVSIRIVTTPERVVIREAKRNYEYLKLYQYKVDAVIVNNIYPVQAMEGYFGKWMQMQEQALTDLTETFQEKENVPILKLELQPQEICGIPLLLEAAQKIWGEKEADITGAGLGMIGLQSQEKNKN